MRAAVRIWLPAVLAATLLVGLLAGCAAKEPRAQALPGTLAVAGFTNPQNTWELLAGCLPEKCVLVDSARLNRLDGFLGDSLAAAGRSDYFGPGTLKPCEQLALRDVSGTQRQAAMAHWLAVGRCLSADFLLVPQLLSWRDLNLPEEQPASVTMDFFLLDVRNERILRRFHFEETQQPLTSNLLEAGKFFRRGAKWISAEELAREGVAQAVKELKL